MPFTDYAFPPYSFLRGNDDTEFICAPGEQFCVPAASQYTLSGAMLFRDWSNPSLDLSIRYYLTPVRAEDWVDCINSNVGTTVDVADYPPFISGWGGVDVVPDENFIPASYNKGCFFNIYHNNFFDLLPDPILVGECFRWLILEVYVDELGVWGTQAEVIACTNCFYRADFDCHMSILRYSCNENAFAFPYSGLPGFHNIVQLPMYQKSPQFEEEEDSYRKSDGTYKKLYQRTDQVYGLEIDWLPYREHMRIQTALGSDNLSIEDKRPEFGLRGYDRIWQEAYEIEWPENMEYSLAKANTKVKASIPLSLFNSNCS